MKLLILILDCMLATACSAQQRANSSNNTTPNDSIMSYSNERFDFQYYDSLVLNNPNGYKFTKEDGTKVRLRSGYYGRTKEVRSNPFIATPPPIRLLRK